MSDELEISDGAGAPASPEEPVSGAVYDYRVQVWDQDRLVMSNDNAEAIRGMLNGSVSHHHAGPNRHERRRAAKRARGKR